MKLQLWVTVVVPRASGFECWRWVQEVTWRQSGASGPPRSIFQKLSKSNIWTHKKSHWTENFFSYYAWLDNNPCLPRTTADQFFPIFSKSHILILKCFLRALKISSNYNRLVYNYPIPPAVFYWIFRISTNHIFEQYRYIHFRVYLYKLMKFHILLLKYLFVQLCERSFEKKSFNGGNYMLFNELYPNN